MEIKYCERCGKLLGYVMKSKKYCIDCYAIANREKDRERHRKKQAIKEAELKKPVPCAWCGKPLVRRVQSQKYHPECQKSANMKRQKELRAIYREKGITQKGQKEMKSPFKKKRKNGIPSVLEVNNKAKELGVSYGKLVQMMEHGEVVL